MAISRNQTSIIIGIIILLVGIALGMVFTQKSASVQNQSLSGTPQITFSQTQDPEAVCYWYWHFKLLDQLDENTVAPSGYNYALVDLNIKNNASKPVFTSSNYWTFTADRITYSFDPEKFANLINYQDVRIENGGEINIQLVYVVKETTEEAVLKYSGPTVPMKNRYID